MNTIGRGRINPPKRSTAEKVSESVNKNQIISNVIDKMMYNMTHEDTIQSSSESLFCIENINVLKRYERDQIPRVLEEDDCTSHVEYDEVSSIISIDTDYSDQSPMSLSDFWTEEYFEDIDAAMTVITAPTECSDGSDTVDDSHIDVVVKDHDDRVVFSVEDIIYLQRLEHHQAMMMDAHAGEDEDADDERILQATNYMDSLAKASKDADFNVPDEFKATLEGLTAVYFAAKDCTTLSQFVAIMVLYIRANVKGSLSGKVITYVRELFSKDEEMEAQSNEIPKWLQYLREGRTYYKLLKNHCIFGQLSKLMGLLVVLGICNASTLDFNIAGFKMFDSKIVDIYNSCDSIVDAGLKVVLYFCEAGYQCFVKGSIKPLLFNEHEAIEIDDEYHQLTSWWEVVQAGNLEKVFGVTDAEFHQRMEKLCTKLRETHNALTNAVDKKILSTKIHTICAMMNDYVTLKISGGVRRAPFAIELFGPSSQGKSTFNETVITSLLRSANLPVENEYRATINANDDFMSNWTSDKLVAVLDDLANERADMVKTCPTRHIIDLCNNERYYANKAELHLKGKCFVEPEIVVATTNKKNLDAAAFSNCPYSVQRRMKYVITVNCKPELTQSAPNSGRNLGMSSEKVHAQNTYEGVFSPPAIEDNWDLTVEVAVTPEKLTDVAGYEVVKNKYDGNKPLENVSAQTVIAFLIEEFHAWRDGQARLLESNKVRKDQIQLCVHPGCHQLMQTCPYHAEENAEAESNITKERVKMMLKEPSKELKPSFKGPWKHKKDVNIEAIKAAVEEHKAEQAVELEKHASVLSPLLYNFSVGGSFITRRLTAWGIMRQIQSKVDADINAWCGSLAEAGTSTLYNYLLFLERRWNWWSILPDKWVESPYFKEYVLWYNQDSIKKSVRNNTILNCLGALFCLGTSCANKWTIPINVILLIKLYLRQGAVIKKAQDDCMAEVLKRKHSVPKIVQKAKDKTLSNMLLMSSVLAGIYFTAQMWHKWRSFNCQGNLEPTTQEDINERDAEENVFAPLLTEPVPVNMHTATATSKQLQNVLEKALVHGTFDRGESNPLVLNALVMDTNCVIVPDHYFETQEEFRAIFKRHNKLGNAQKFRSIISKNKSVLIPGTDIRLCYMPSGGSAYNLSKWLPDDTLQGSTPFKMLLKRKDGTLVSGQGVCKPQKINNGNLTFDGYYYDRFSLDTFHGLCGAPILSETKNPVIMGIHLAGKAGTPLGGAGQITRKMFSEAHAALARKEGVILPGSASEMPKEVMGIKYLCSGEADKKSPLRFLPHGSQFINYGRCIGSATYRSDVRQLPISNTVHEIMGVPNEWGPPKFSPGYFGWQKALENASQPAIPFESWLLDAAIADYQKPLINLCKSELWKSTCPLTDYEVINGIPGVKFIDALKIATAIGYPATGPKSEHIIEGDLIDGIFINRTFKDHVWEEIRRVESCLRKGERAYCIAKACKKDEVLPSGKDKCRIFYGNSIAMTFLIRKYYLPLIRIMQMHPTISECAVGVNCHSQEWDQLTKYMDKFGREQTIGGDYSKYDQKIPSQLLFAALRILINMAEVLNYNEDDLAIMNALCGELVYAVIAFNGDLISVTEGLHISGNSLTVILNGICGSLNLRCYYYSVYPKEESFRDYVALITYGDDNKGSASSERPRFNVAAIAEFLGRYGQQYTNPDKTAAKEPYLNPDTCDFLKRTSVYHPAIGYEIGALCEKSIFKSLHNALIPKGSGRTTMQASGEAIDNALTEWFNHGEKKYEMRRQQLIQVINKHDLDNKCSGHLLSYGDRVDRWRENYENPGGAGS